MLKTVVFELVQQIYRQGYHTSLFLRFVLILQYVLENINVLISKKCPYL